MAGENVVRDPLITGSGYVETGSFLDIKSGAEFRVAGVDITSHLASLGQEDTFANVSGGDYTAPLLVYIDGYDATLGYDTIAAADMSDLNTRAMYIIVDDIAYGDTGTAYKFRQATGLNTNAYTVDDKVYLQSSGAYSTAPAGTTDVTQEVGVVRVKSTTVGVIDFYPGAAMVQGIEATDIKGLTASSAELNVLDGVTGGTVLASLGVVVDGSKDIGEFGTLTAATLSRDSNDLTVSSTTTGSVLVDGIDGVEVNSASGDINIGNDAVTGAVNLGTGAAARPIAIGNAASASLAVEGGVGGIDIDCDTTFDVLAGGAFSIDGTGASNVTAASGALTLATTTSGDIFADSAANILLSPASGSTVQVQDGADNTKVIAFDASNITTGNTRALVMADVNYSLDELSTAPTLTPQAEAADVISIVFASPVSSVERYIATALDDTTMEVNTAAFAISETGVGAEVSPGARGQLIFTTDASGDATLAVADVATASGKTVWITVEPLFASADQAQACAPASVAITFD